LGEKGQHLIVNGNRRGRWQVTGDEGPVSSWLRYIPPRSGGWPILHILASGNTGRNPKTILLEMPLIENKEFGYYRNGKYGARGIIRYGQLLPGGREESLDPPS
jgi:hypothetical protein